MSSYSVMEFAGSISISIGTGTDNCPAIVGCAAGAYLICRSVPDDVAVWGTCAVF